MKIKPIYIEFLSEFSKDFLSKKVLLFLYILYYLIHIVIAVNNNHFPRSYSWSELFINYEGGFVRRGLLGQTLLLASTYISVYYLALTVYICMLFALLYISLKTLVQTFDLTTIIFVFMSPAFFLFLTKDVNMFFRKDLIVEIILFFMCSMCVDYLCDGKKNLFRLTTAFFIVYALSFMIHEMSIFYVSIPLMLLSIAFYKENKFYIWFLLCAVVVLTSLYVAFHYSGTTAHTDAIYASWHKIYPTLTTVDNAISYIGIDLTTNMTTVKQHHANAITMRSAVWGAFLAFLPIIFIFAAYNPLRGIYELMPSLKLRLLLCIALLTPWMMPIIANDFGRHISSACMIYLFFLISIQKLAPQQCAPWLKKWNESLNTSMTNRLITIGGIMLYGTSWTLMHWQPVGHSYVKLSGILYNILYFHK